MLKISFLHEKFKYIHFTSKMSPDFPYIRDLIIENQYEEAFSILIKELDSCNLHLYLDEIRYLNSRYNNWLKDSNLNLTSLETGNRIIHSLIVSISQIEKYISKKKDKNTTQSEIGINGVNLKLNQIINKIENIENRLKELSRKYSNTEIRNEIENLNKIVESEKSKHENLSFIDSYFNGNKFNTTLVDSSSLLGKEIRVPNFLLFQRNNKTLLVILDSEKKVNPYKLQKTNEPQLKAELLIDEGAFGFNLSETSPFSINLNYKIDRGVYRCTYSCSSNNFS